MNSNNNNNEDSCYKDFASLLNNLSPLEFTLLGSITGYFIALNLTQAEQNAIGNWFELIGQIIITFSTMPIDNSDNNNDSQLAYLYSEINKLKSDIEKLKNN